ncbi:MAG: hypothetical protein V4773_07300 [Verrucomicrobiota bacterium]
MTSPPNYRRAFWASRHHAWLGVFTLGLGFASGEPLALLAGAVVYALGLVYLPDSGFFRRTVDARENAARDAAAAAELATFQQQQEQMLAALSLARRTRYQQFVSLCSDLEITTTDPHTSDNVDAGTLRQKLTELTFSLLRMLTIEQSLAVYLETERKEQVPSLVASLEAETQALAAEIAPLKQLSPAPATLANKERLLTSRLERLQALQQRLTRIEQAQTNHDLLRSEQERLVEQVKLIRAEAVASKNADNLTSRIDLSIEHLASTNKWLSEIAEFKSLTAPMPTLPQGATPSAPSPEKPLQPQPQPPVAH